MTKLEQTSSSEELNSKALRPTDDVNLGGRVLGEVDV